MENLIEGLKWVGGTIGLLLAGFGVSKLRELKLKHTYDRQNKAFDIHFTNDGERAKAEASIVTELLKRQEASDKRQQESEDRLNARIDKLQDELGAQREMNARKDEKIKNLEGENEKLRERIREQDKLITQLQTEVEQLKGMVQQNVTNIRALKNQ